MKNQLYVGQLLKVMMNPFTTLKKAIKGHPHYQCRMGRAKTQLKLTDDALVIRQQQGSKQLPFKKIGQASIHENMWEIRVKIKCDHKVYKFDFPSLKKARDFYEQIIFNKVQSHS